MLVRMGILLIDISVIYNSRTFHHISHISAVVVYISVYVENLPEAFSNILVTGLYPELRSVSFDSLITAHC